MNWLPGPVVSKLPVHFLTMDPILAFEAKYPLSGEWFSGVDFWPFGTRTWISLPISGHAVDGDTWSNFQGHFMGFFREPGARVLSQMHYNQDGFGQSPTQYATHHPNPARRSRRR